ncbi:hypothetical protein [Nocardia carnea]|uniref:Uncharacterized protein n=1 Tax=Nocardia carnea TaxID=37328 RepID=A0ABW7TL44_9NOCA|nr:hypothetical protein [Nocardia carnea]
MVVLGPADADSPPTVQPATSPAATIATTAFPTAFMYCLLAVRIPLLPSV